MPLIDLKWGPSGTKKAVTKNNIIVIVDVLRFSSATTVAVYKGVIIIPSYSKRLSKVLAKRFNAEISGSSREPTKWKYSLSPLSYLNAKKNTKVVLFSPNGAKCSAIAGHAKHAFVGSFLNATIIGNYVSRISRKINEDVTVVSAGETELTKLLKRLPVEESFVNKENKEYFALEDFLGSGAIISATNLDRTTNARHAELSYLKYRNNLLETLKSCVGARYLINSGREHEVDFCLQLDKYNCVPKISGDRIINLTIKNHFI
jgi:2-phosphosulfolactate phosphatase